MGRNNKDETILPIYLGIALAFAVALVRVCEMRPQNIYEICALALGGVAALAMAGYIAIKKSY